MAERLWRWYRYDDSFIPLAGWRTFIDVDIGGDRAYGYVWETPNGMFGAKWDDLQPGEVLDRELGPFTTMRAARRAIIDALVKEYR